MSNPDRLLVQILKQAGQIAPAPDSARQALAQTRKTLLWALQSPPRRLFRKLITPISVAAMLIAAFAFIWRLVPNAPNSAAFAQTVSQLEKAKSITWKTTIYEQIISKDEKTTWLQRIHRDWAYKAPGLYRMTSKDESGDVKWIEITDAVRNLELRLYPKEKKAILKGLAVVTRSPNGPFAWCLAEMKQKDLQWIESRKTENGEINVFRVALWDEANARKWSYDFWIDQKTKQLAEAHVPGADIYDPAKETAPEYPPDAAWSKMTGDGFAEHDIVYDVELADSLFSLEPPEGYVLERLERPAVTEREMIDYLGALADFNDKVFPDQVAPFPFSSDRVSKAWSKPENEQTEAERKLHELKNHYMMAGLNAMPTGHFIEDHTQAGSFRYLGRGVKLGDKDRIVCWYKLNNTSDYRVVYGDLSVKDIPGASLPLPVE